MSIRRPTASLALILAILPATGCKQRETASIPSPPPAVTVAQPVQREVIEWDEYPGRLAAVEWVEVKARVSGFIVAAHFDEGAVVQKGDLLFEIDVRPFQAELESRQAELARAEAQTAIAQIEFNRVKNLLSRQAAAPIEFQTAEANLRQAQAMEAAARAAVEAARLSVEWCRVTAPIAGRVSRKYVTAGNLISGGGEQATLLTTITSIDPIYCYVDVDERSVLKYQRLAREKKRVSARQARIPCSLGLANETGFPHHGVIDFVDNRVDPQTGTIRARGVFPNPDGRLIPGFFARLRVPGSGAYQTLLVPDSAVGTNQNQKLLLVVDPSQTVQPQPVELGPLFGTLRSIQAGIDPDDRVIIEGQVRVQPGMKVKPHEISIHVPPLDLPVPATKPAIARSGP